MRYQGIARLDFKTKNLVKRLKTGEIAIINHDDLDRVTAESLAKTGVEAVVNVGSFISGRYPNVGPLILSSHNVYLVENVGEKIFSRVKEGERIGLRGGRVFLDGKEVAYGEVLTPLEIEKRMEEAKKKLGKELERFATNTLHYIEKEKDLIFDETILPPTKTDFLNRHALVVVRGYNYKEDLTALRSYIREVRPILIGVDGGADALIEEGLKPGVIIGDMDSVSDEALLSGAEIILHAYKNGEAPGYKRLKRLNLSPLIFKAAGTSEDIALLLAYEKGAELIVAVGTHANLVEFLDKGREGMSSTFLVRLRVGDKLVDAKGVNKLYRSTVKFSYLLVMVLAALAVIVAVIMASSKFRQIIWLLVLYIRSVLGI